MRNLWIVTDMPHATWAADLTSAGETARRLADQFAATPSGVKEDVLAGGGA